MAATKDLGVGRGRALEELALGDFQDKVLALLLQRELLAFEVQRFGKQKLFLAAPLKEVGELRLVVVLGAGDKEVVHVHYHHAAKFRATIALPLLVEHHPVERMLSVPGQESPCHFAGPCARSRSQPIDVPLHTIEGALKDPCQAARLILRRSQKQIGRAFTRLWFSLQERRAGVTAPQEPLGGRVLQLAVDTGGVHREEDVL